MTGRKKKVTFRVIHIQPCELPQGVQRRKRSKERQGDSSRRVHRMKILKTKKTLEFRRKLEMGDDTGAWDYLM